MKKYIGILLIVMLIVQSCKKDDIQEQSINTGKNQVQRKIGNNIEDKIVKFIDRMDLVRENSTYNESEIWNYSLDSAVWYIEAALNYKYAYPNEKRSRLVFDSMRIDIEMENSDVANIVAIQKSFDFTLSKLVNKFELIKSNHKFLISADYKVLGTLEGQICLMVYYYFGNYSVTLPDGNWMVAGGEFGVGGMCNGSTPRPYKNFDATNKLEQDLFNSNTCHLLDVGFANINTLSPDCGLGGYQIHYGVVNSFTYTPMETSFLYEEYFTNTNGNNSTDCLLLSYMNAYKSNVMPVINNFFNATQRTIFVEDIDWSFDLVQIPAPFHNYHNFIGQDGEMYPRIAKPDPMFYL